MSFTEKKKIGHFIEEDPDLLESLGKKRRKSTHKNHGAIDEGDDDFSPTVKERDRKMREKRKEAAKRVRYLFVQVRFSQKGSKSIPKFTSENLKNIQLEDGCLAGFISDIHMILRDSVDPVNVNHEPQQGTRSQAICSFRT